MDADLKARWVAALRSGKYQQGVGRLFNKHEGTYCCLGVLCAVAKVEFNYASVAACLGLHSNAELECIDRNDGNVLRGQPSLSFIEIANYIEENL